MADLVECSITAGVAHLVLNRPEAANALDLPLATELLAAVRAVAADDAVRVVLVTGAGARFCGGGDVASFVAAPDPPAYLTELATAVDAALQVLAAMEKPVVAAVQGAVAGAGLAVMLSCDLVVAQPRTKFAFAYPGIGLTPDCGLSYLLPRAIGSQRALSFALGGETLTASTALEWGLVTELADDPVTRARDLAGRLSSGAPGALGQTRRLLRSAWEADRATTGAEEARTIGRMVTGEEAQRLIGRFLAR